MCHHPQFYCSKCLKDVPWCSHEEMKEKVFHACSCARSCVCAFLYMHTLCCVCSVLQSWVVWSRMCLWRCLAGRLWVARILCFISFSHVTSSLFIQRADELEHVWVVKTTWGRTVKVNQWNIHFHLPVYSDYSNTHNLPKKVDTTCQNLFLNDLRPRMTH